MGDPVRAALRLALRRLVRRGLRGIWLRGTLPDTAFVWAANHHSWWDPFVAAAVLGNRPAGVLVAEQNLRRYRFTARLGAISAAAPRRGLDLLRSGRVLVIYPEGVLRPSGPPGPLARGAAWYARQAAVPLCAAAVRVVLRGHQLPEAYVELSTVDCPVTGLLADRLHSGLSHMDALIATTPARDPLPGFALVAPGYRSWDERL